MAFADNYSGLVEVQGWENDFKLYPGRQSNYPITGLGDLTGVTLSCEVRSSRTSESSLFVADIVIDDVVAGDITITFSDDDTPTLINERRAYIALDGEYSGVTYPVRAGKVPVEPYGTGLPVQPTQVEFQEMKEQLEAIRDQVVAIGGGGGGGGVTELNQLLDVSNSNPADKNVLVGSGSTFAARALQTGDVNGLDAALSGKVDDSQVLTDVPAGAEFTDTITTVEDNLTTASATSALSANQGVVLLGLVNSINAVLTSDETTLDELQEIVDYIQTNRADLDALGISGVTGLQAALDAKSDTSHQHTESDITDLAAQASQAEAEAGTEAAVRRWSPLRIAQAIAALASGGVNWAVQQISSITDGAGEVAFDLNTTNTISAGKLLELLNNGNLAVSVNADGSVTLQQNTGQTRSHLRLTTANGYDPQLESDLQLWLKVPSVKAGLTNANGGSVRAELDSNRFIYVSPSTNTIGSQFYSADFTILGPSRSAVDEERKSLILKGADAKTTATTHQDGGDIVLQVGAKATGGGNNGNVVAPDLPTSDPLVSGALWDDSGTIKRSAG